MTRPLRIEFAQAAHDDLRDIMDWHAAQGVPHVGTRLAQEVVDRVRQLAAFLDSGKTVPEFDNPSLRELEHPPFRIVYRHDDGAVTIARVWRSERLMDPELGGSV
jgi:plasmid stabilization system protein ParE